jgi:SAM-dependent methyltransferase
MNKSIKEFVASCAGILPLQEPIYEFGSLQVVGQEGFADLRPLFPGKKYIGADMRPGLGVDIVLDLAKIDLYDQCAGTVLLLDTLEHVEYVSKALEEVYRILKPGGTVVIQSVLDFPIHAYPNDYWRFTPESFKSLLKPFGWSYVGYAGKKSFPHTIIGVGIKDPVPAFDRETFQSRMEQWSKDTYYYRGFWRDFIITLTPPIIIDTLRKIRGTY